MKHLSIWGPILLTIGIITVVLLVVLGIGKKQGWFGNEGFLKVALEKGLNREIVEIITANGKIQPETEVKISSSTSSAWIDSITVKEGDWGFIHVGSVSLFFQFVDTHRVDKRLY